MSVFSPLLVDVSSSQMTDEENTIARQLGQRLVQERSLLGVLDQYYNGEQRIEDLGISVPPVMHHLRTVTGWPRTVVDALDERLDVQGFRYPNSTTADSDIWDIWQANCLDEESQLAHIDALIFGRAFVMVGSNPRVALRSLTVESPQNMAARWDAQEPLRYRSPAGLFDGRRGGCIALYAEHHGHPVEAPGRRRLECHES